MERVNRGAGSRLLIGLAVGLVAASCSTPESAPTTTYAVVEPSGSSVPTPTAPPTTEPELPRPIFAPRADHLIFAPVPPRPADKPEDFPTPDGSADYMELFEPGALWTDAREAMTGFKIHGWMIRHYLTDDELVTIDRALRTDGVPLVIEAEPLDPPDPDECAHSESFEGPYELESLRRLRDLDVHVAAIAVEQPHTYAVLSRAPGACRYTLERTLDELGRWIASVKDIYPDVVIGSIEGLWVELDDPAQAYADWLDGFAEAFGEPLPFIHVDVDWRRPDWVEAVRAIETVADERGVPFGVLYNGTLGDAQTGEEWLQLTAERFAEYETIGGGTPQHASLQSWVDLPDRLLPDDEVGAFSHLLARYAGTRTDVVDVEIVTGDDGTYLTGRVVDPSGIPVGGQWVSVEVIPTDGSPSTATRRGVVPDFATGALVLIRAHVEGAASGDTDVWIRRVEFSEAGGDNLVPNGDFTAGAESWPSYGDPVGDVRFESDGSGGRQMRIIAEPDEVVFVDGARFEVTPGAEYEFAVTMGGTDASIGTVGVAIAFVSDVEGARETILFSPTPAELGSTESRSDGTFQVPLGVSGVYDVVVSVAGDARTWPVTRRTSADGN